LVRLILDSSMGSYPVVIGTGVQKELRETISRLDPTGVAIVTDTNVRPWALKVAKAIKPAGLKLGLLAVPPAERSTTPSQLKEVPGFLGSQRLDRGRAVVPVRRGVVAVFDPKRHKTVLVRAGHRLLVPA